MVPNVWHWDWFLWSVVAPIAGPIALSAAIVGMWQLGPWAGSAIDWAIVFDDMSPWALSFYCVTLICVTMHDFWPKMSSHPVLGWGLIGAAIFVALYAAVIVLFRQSPTFQAGTRLWQVTFVFLLTVVYLCHSAIADLRLAASADLKKEP